MFKVLLCVCLLHSVACNIVQNEATNVQPSQSTDVEQDSLVQQLVTRMEYLEEKLKEQEAEISYLKKKHEVDLQGIRNDYENKLNIIKKEIKMDLNYLQQNSHVSLDNGSKGIVADSHVEENKEDNKAERSADETFVGDVPAADEEKPVDMVETSVGEEPAEKRSFEPSKQKQRTRRLNTDFNVSFFAKIVQNVHHLGQGQNVIFDTAVTNNGNGYNPYLGAFVAPVGGTYLFSTTLVTFNNDTSHYGIFVNDNRVTIIYLNGVDNNSDSTSQTVILQLNEQDVVTVRHLDADKSLVGYHHSLFSGVLIAQEDLGSSIVGK